jgi:hypothetical protein
MARREQGRRLFSPGEAALPVRPRRRDREAAEESRDRAEADDEEATAEDAFDEAEQAVEAAEDALAHRS